METAQDVRVDYRRIADLTPFEGNARTHSDEQVAQIAASIVEFGWTNPVLIDCDGGVIAGHGRLLAARKLGMVDVPCIEVGNLTAAQKRALVIADNKLAMNAGWDMDQLAVELTGLKADGYDLALTGFSPDELLALLAEPTEGLTDEDAVPEVQDDPVTKPGDVWVLGKHRVMCGDSTSVDDIERLVNGQPVDMWLTDPPYNVALGMNESPEEAKRRNRRTDGKTVQNDAMGDEKFRQFLRDACVTADTVMKAGAVFYIWHADSEGYNFRGACKDAGWQVRQCLVWKKQTIVMGRQDYHWKHEPCLYGWKEGAAHLWAADRKQSTILEFDRPSRSGEHPTMKPVALFEYQMLNNTKGGDIVLDSFGGSGTTLIAAEKNGRYARLMELDPKYVDVIIKRWQEFTGKDAALESTGQPFSQLIEVAA